SSASTSSATATSIASSDSLRASSNSSPLSLSRVSRPLNVPTTDSSCLRSLPSSWARFGSPQTPGSSRARATALSRCALASKSKIPPQIGSALLQSGKGTGDLVDAFGFHGPAAPSFGWQIIPCGPQGPLLARELLARLHTGGNRL